MYFTNFAAISMLNRLQPLERNRKMAINELQPELHPSEALFDVKKLLVVGNVRDPHVSSRLILNN